MADPDPADSTRLTSQAPADVGTLRTLPPGPDHRGEVDYRPLSLLALLGFGLASLYAVLVAIPGVVGLIKGTPLLWPGWTVLAPLTAAALCLIARVRIKRSEGTLAGERLASRGLMLSLFVGLTYWAYYFAVGMAIGQQAEAFAGQWLGLLKEGKVTRAAFLTINPVQREGLNEAALDPRAVEGLMGVTGGPGGSVSAMKRFTQVDMVRLITEGGAATEIEPRGVVGWDFVRGAYEVRLSYRIKTPECWFDVLVTVQGSEAPHKEFEGRKWKVDVNQTGAAEVAEGQPAIHFTEHGQALQRLRADGTRFLNVWQQKLAANDLVPAFLDTLPPGQREPTRISLERAAPLGAAAGGAAAASAVPDPTASAAYREFLAGKLVRVDPDRFLGGEDSRKQVLAAIRQMFARESGPGGQFQLDRSRPKRKLEGEKVRMTFDFTFMQPPGYSVQGEVILEGDAKTLGSEKPAEWRIVGINLLGGRTMPQRPAGAGP